MLPTNYVQIMAVPQTAILKAYGDFALAAFNAAQHITENNISAFMRLAGFADLKETHIRNFEVIAALWKPFCTHPTT